MLVGICRRFGTVDGVGLVQNVSDVVAQRPEADEQFFGDFAVGWGPVSVNPDG